MTYAIVVTLVALAGIGATMAAIRHYRRKVAKVSEELNEALKASQEQQREIGRLRHIIAAEEEIIHEAGEKKRKMRANADPGDRARAATGLMSDLSKGGD